MLFRTARLLVVFLAAVYFAPATVIQSPIPEILSRPNQPEPEPTIGMPLPPNLLYRGEEIHVYRAAPIPSLTEQAGFMGLALPTGGVIIFLIPFAQRIALRFRLMN